MRFLVSLVLTGLIAAQPKLLSWKVAYFHDEDFSLLSFHDIQFGGSDCIFALGTQVTKSKVKPVSVRSIDRGKTWILTALKDQARSAFFLSARLGWMVTEDGVERSNDCGATWERASKEKGLLRVSFRDEALGWAVGSPKKALATRDGGKTWTAIKPNSDPKSDPDRSVYAWVEFATDSFGIIAGWHSPQRRAAQFPIWMDPESATNRRQWPSLTLMLQTIDGGTVWQGFTASLLGKMTRIRLAPSGAGLTLIEFDETFDYPSEVYRLAPEHNTISRIYRDKRHAVSDIALGRDGWTYLAGVQTQGTIRLPVPGKVRILRSQDDKTWMEDPVDYRASANRVFLATAPDGRMMAATDTGMILRLE